MSSSISPSEDGWEDETDSEDETQAETQVISKDHFAYCFNPEDENSPQILKDNFMSALLDSSDNSCYPRYEGHNILPDDWDEAVIGWKELPPNVKYLPRRKQKKNLEPENDKQKSFQVRGNTSGYRNEDSQSFSNWKSNVEPVTYRYIPNNGQYRLNKFCKEEREWYTVRRRNAERVTPTLKARYLQREIKRQLKKDFSKKSSRDEKIPTGNVRRSQSTNSEKFRETSSSSFGTLMKSASDLYVENINSRLNELDQEIKKDSQILKSHEDQGRTFPFNITKGKLHSKVKETSVAPYRGSSGVQSAFIITPVGPQETLRPLEKITPQQRMKEDIVKAAVKNQVEDSGNGDSPNSETIVKSAIDVTNFDLERLRIMPLAETSRTYIDKIVKNKKEGSSILSGNGNKRMGTQFVSSITVDGSGTSIDDVGITDTGNQTHSSRCTKRTDPNLPEISGRRLEVSLTNYRLL